MKALVLLLGLHKYVLADGRISDEGYILNFDSPIYVCPDDESQAFVDTSEAEVKRHNETTAYLTGFIKFIKGNEPATMDTFLIKDFVVNTEDLPINSAIAGRYKVTMNIYTNQGGKCLSDKTFIACLQLDFIIEAL